MAINSPPGVRTDPTSLTLLLLLIVNLVFSIQCGAAHMSTVVRRSPHSLKSTPEEINAADDLRAEYLQRKAFAKFDRDGVTTSAMATVTSGLSIGTPNYITDVSVGTPLRDQTFILDTGSDLTWMQCKPCVSCYVQTDPIFDPKTSSSFRFVDCNDKVKCSYLLGPYKTPCAGAGRPCPYQETYLDGSISKGDFITESIQIAGYPVKPVSLNMGCGHYNQGTMAGYDGILALSRDLVSFPTQTNLSSFATCLPPPNSSPGNGFLDFLPEKSTYDNANFICLNLMYPQQTGIYLVALAGFSIMPATVKSTKFSEAGTAESSDGVDSSDLDAAGSYYSDFKDSAPMPNLMVLDTGALNSRLKEADYVNLRDAFKAATARFLTPAPSVMGYDTCYTYVSANNALNQNLLPQVGLKFSGSNKLYILPPASLFYRWTYSITCFAFKTTKGFAILGNNHQQGRRLHWDTAKNRVCLQASGSSCK